MMTFRDKEDAMRQIVYEAQGEAQYWSNSLMNQPLNYAISQIIGYAVAAGIRKAIELQYTQDDFEKDIQLKP
jgi:hypothetical protein